MIKNLTLRRQVERIERLVQQSSQATASDLALHAHWGRYLCVLVAGFMENAIFEIYSEFVYRCSPEPVARYAAARLERISNPKASTFVETARAFKDTWAIELDNFLADDGRKDAVDSIMSNRHQIAHGQDTGITLARVNSYFVKCVAVVEFIEKQCA